MARLRMRRVWRVGGRCGVSWLGNRCLCLAQRRGDAKHGISALPKNKPRIGRGASATIIAVGDESSRNPRITVIGGKPHSGDTRRLAPFVVTPLRGFPYCHPIRGFLADSSPAATVVLALRASKASVRDGIAHGIA